MDIFTENLLNIIKRVKPDVNSQFFLKIIYLVKTYLTTKVKIWNHQISNQSLFELQTNHTDSIQAFAYNERFNYLAIGSKDKTFSLWKRRDEYEGINLKTINYSRQVNIIAILPNTNIVTGSLDSTIKIWRSESPYECIANLTGHPSYICQPCHNSCLTCNYSCNTSCLSCNNSVPAYQYYNSYLSTCTQTCQEEFYLSNYICQPCDNSCLNCNQTSKNCTSCHDGFYLNIQGMC